MHTGKLQLQNAAIKNKICLQVAESSQLVKLRAPQVKISHKSSFVKKQRISDTAYTWTMFWTTNLANLKFRKYYLLQKDASKLLAHTKHSPMPKYLTCWCKVCFPRLQDINNKVCLCKFLHILLYCPWSLQCQSHPTLSLSAMQEKTN